MLEVFKNEDIHATWATVGLLMCDNKDALMKHIPFKKPTYLNSKHSNYNSLETVGENEKEDPYHYGPSLLKHILRTPNQEFSSHTFSHYYCLEKGQTKEDFEVDVSAFDMLASSYGLKATSIVFPRNQYNSDYFSILHKKGFTSFRGNESHWIYVPRSREKESLLRRFIRLLDGYLNLSGHHTYCISNLKKVENLLNIPASRFFRPYHKKLFFLETLKLRRIKKSMKHAAVHGEVFHLWWHPHNFGQQQEQMLSQLKEILNYYRFLKGKYGMESLTMNEIALRYDENK
jgi:hypothetical protein